ncbi:transposase [Demequina litorisediminis]|uniref:transposase n=1 Tax=Demequina litorisediminis TaxID=1849022 RepID=UPI0024E09DD3|nr:transposase [Demequina litorisediminis]
MGRPGYPSEFRRRVLDLVANGRGVASVSHDLEVSEQTIYNWLRQGRIDRGIEAGLTTAEKDEITSAKRRIAELETEPRSCSPRRRCTQGAD